MNEFVICLGYKGYVIKEYFYHYFLHSADVTIDMADNRVEYHNNRSEPWRVTLVDTGETTMTGGRLKPTSPTFDNGSERRRRRYYPPCVPHFLPALGPTPHREAHRIAPRDLMPGATAAAVRRSASIELLSET